MTDKDTGKDTGKDTAHDPVQALFERLRTSSPNAPALNKPVPKMNLNPQGPAEPKKYQVGKPSGPDGRRRRRPLDVPSLGEQIHKEIGRRGWEHELANGWVMGNWENLVGERVAAHATPRTIKDGVVYVDCDSSSWTTQLRYLQRSILQKIAERLGPDVIVKLHIQGPTQRRNYDGRQWVKPQGSQDTYG
ncbi:DciA family protein [Corynebacterium sp.]|uniref:DciA family protein n=1 Tax=Corynebacterium sp. TaxID=1720 RepID=UPI0026DD7DF3|nr:DciA family protein [Corynebacterium sp.]MDO5032187.1 DciA family protein [Corynebacterium sp.]